MATLDVDPDAMEVVGGGPPGVPAEVYRRVFGASFGLAFVVDEGGAIRAMSDAATGLFPGGASALGEVLAEASWWSEPVRVAESLESARTGLFDRFYTRVDRGGTSRTLLVDVQSVEGPDESDWVLLEARDVTELLASEHQLHDAVAQLERQRARLDAVLEASRDLICAVDREGRVTHANDAWLRAVHVTVGGPVLVGDPYVGRSPNDAYWRTALDGRAVDARVRLPPGGGPEARWVDVAYTPVFADDGRALGAMAVGRDVTDRVDAAQVRLALSGAGAAPFLLDGDGRLASPAPALAHALGVAPEAETLDELLASAADPTSAAEAVRAVLATPGAALDLEVAVADGGTVRLRGHATGSADGVRLVGVAYAEGGRADAEADERWADLLARAGWGGRADAEYVAHDGPPAAPLADADRDRLDALRRTGLLDSPEDSAFDALTRLVSAALGVPISLVSLVDADRQFFKSQTGLGGAVAGARETPLSHSFCRHVVAERRPLVVEDARRTPLVADNGAVEDLDVIAYLGVPVAAPDGHVIGALCAIDHEAHAWTDDDVRLLSSVAEAVTAEVAAHQSRHPDPT